MKKIILTIILSSFLSAIAVADDHIMRNKNVNASSLMEGKHMMNKNVKASSLMEGKHMMDDNPFSKHSKHAAGAAKTNEHVKKGYTVIKYKK